MKANLTKAGLSKYQMAILNGLTLEQCREALDVLKKRVRQLSHPDYQSFRDISVRDLGLSTRSYHVLVNSQINTVGDIIDHSIKKIGLLNRCGPVCHREIKDVILKQIPKESHDKG